jgi:hypothetical protein
MHIMLTVFKTILISELTGVKSKNVLSYTWGERSAEYLKLPYINIKITANAIISDTGTR